MKLALCRRCRPAAWPPCLPCGIQTAADRHPPRPADAAAGGGALLLAGHRVFASPRGPRHGCHQAAVRNDRRHARHWRRAPLSCRLRLTAVGQLHQAGFGQARGHAPPLPFPTPRLPPLPGPSSGHHSCVDSLALPVYWGVCRLSGATMAPLLAPRHVRDTEFRAIEARRHESGRCSLASTMCSKLPCS